MLPLLREYLGSLPFLHQLIEQELNTMQVNVNNFEELKSAREEARNAAVQKMKDARGIYRLLRYPSIQEAPCPQCGEKPQGAHIEYNNAASGRGYMLPTQLNHQFLAHGIASVNEPVTNLGGSQMSEHAQNLDVRRLIQLLEGASLPQPVQEELMKQFSRA